MRLCLIAETDGLFCDTGFEWHGWTESSTTKLFCGNFLEFSKLLRGTVNLYNLGYLQELVNCTPYIVTVPANKGQPIWEGPFSTCFSPVGVWFCQDLTFEIYQPVNKHSFYKLTVLLCRSPSTIMRAQQWDRVWNLAVKVRPIHQHTLGVWRVSEHFSLVYFPSIFLLFHHLPRHLCWLMSDLACRSLEVTDYKLVLCQSALWWGEMMVTLTHMHAHSYKCTHITPERKKGALLKLMGNTFASGLLHSFLN